MGAIVWKVREAAERSGVRTPAELAERLEIAHNTALALWRGTPSQAHLPTLVKVCERLGARVCDLLEYTEENQYAEIVEELLAA